MRTSASTLHPQLKWLSSSLEDAEGSTIEVQSLCYKSHFYVPKMQSGAQLLLPTTKHALKSVCERWWDQTSAYPLLVAARFRVQCWTHYPPHDVRILVAKAEEELAPLVTKVTSTQLHCVLHAKAKLCFLFLSLSVFTLIWLLACGVAMKESVRPLVLGLLCMGLALGVGLLCTNSMGRRVYEEMAETLEDFCTREAGVPGYRLVPIGPFALLIERSPG